MTTDSNPNPPAAVSTGPQINPKAQKAALFKFPGLIAIGLYMLLLAGVVVLSVVQGRVGALFLAFPPLFIAGGLGLMMMMRWAWALALAAVTLTAAWCLWSFTTLHDPSFLVQGLLNLIFFLYLVRTEVRAKLR